MRKIEEKMVAAVNNKKDLQLQNTQVLNINGAVFVKLYGTIIYLNIKGKKYFSDGGYKTKTTGSRLRALGANYSTNTQKNGCKLLTQKEIYKKLYSVCGW